MRKRDELTKEHTCMQSAHPNEMTFVLLGRDAAAPATIRAWVEERIRIGKNVYADAQIIEALDCANTMEAEGRRWADCKSSELSCGDPMTTPINIPAALAICDAASRREVAERIAKKAASLNPPKYYTGDDFEPHTWVVDAVQHALSHDRGYPAALRELEQCRRERDEARKERDTFGYDTLSDVARTLRSAIAERDAEIAALKEQRDRLRMLADVRGKERDDWRSTASDLHSERTKRQAEIATTVRAATAEEIAAHVDTEAEERRDNGLSSRGLSLLAADIRAKWGAK